MKMHMKQGMDKATYFPNDNSQALDLVALSFFITLALVYTVFVGVKLIKRIHATISSTMPSRKSEEYRLAGMGDEDDEEELRESFQNQRAELQLQLIKLRRTFHVMVVLSFFVLATGIYLGVRSICYGMGMAN